MVSGPLLSFTRLTMVVEPEDPETIPLFTAPAIRGAFGNRLRRLSCLTRTPECSWRVGSATREETCGLVEHCPYGRIFETLNTGTAQRLQGPKHAPHPFVLKVPRVDGQRVLFAFTLIGRAIDDLPIVLEAMDGLSDGFTVRSDGGGARTLRFETRGIFARAMDGCDYPLASGATWPETRRLAATLSDCECLGNDQHRSVMLDIVSPMHLVARGHPLERFEWSVFLRRLLTRIEVLSQCYCSGTPRPEWFDALSRAGNGVAVTENHTRWAAASRFSSRHRVDLPLGGFVGRVVIESPMPGLLPILRAGEALGVGKNTSSGCGEYELILPEKRGV